VCASSGSRTAASLIGMFGVFNVDKPAGMTSRDVVNRIRRQIRPAKIGHAGTLDRMATGVLLVCVGPATRLIPRVHRWSKSYDTTILLGQRSDTDDVTGNVTTASDAVPIDESRLTTALSRFVGEIEQVPPRVSAVHVEGQRAWRLTRCGHDVKLKARTVCVSRIDCQEYDWPRVRLIIECASGTYIRSIARDLGEHLKCGGVLARLERSWIGPFRIDEAVTLSELSDADACQRHLRSAIELVPEMPQYTCSPQDVEQLRIGRPVLTERIGQSDGSPEMALLTPDRQLAAIAECHGDGRAVPRQVFIRVMGAA